MSFYWPLLDARRNPFSSRKRVSGRLLPAEQATEDGGLSGHMRILDTRLWRIRLPVDEEALVARLLNSIQEENRHG